MGVVRGGRDREREAREARAMESRVEREKEQALADLRTLLPDPRFQRFALRLMGRCGTFAKPVRLFTAERNVLDGRREVGCEIWEELVEANPAIVQSMLLQATTPQKEQAE